MNVWVYVEGESDKYALEALWKKWREELRTAGHGIKIIPLDNKAKYFQKIGARVARIITDNVEDIVIGLPDLYPNKEFEKTEYKHDNIEEIKQVQIREVKGALLNVFNVNELKHEELLKRFLPSSFKHDLEMLLLAAKDQLRTYLGTDDHLGKWKNPVEEQNQGRPPKRIVQELFRTKTSNKRAYRETTDAVAILRKVIDIRSIIFDKNGQVQCPVFKEVIDWIGNKTEILAYH